MKTGPQGIALIKRFEGLRLEAYIPVPGDVPTIGYGTTWGVHMGDKIDLKTADGYLRRDLEIFEHCVNGCVHAEMTRDQFDACVCLAYNIGCTAFKGSTLARLLNAGDISRAADQFLVWNKFQHKPLNGLTRRRMDERKLFLGMA